MAVGLSHRGSRCDETPMRLPWYDSPENPPAGMVSAGGFFIDNQRYIRQQTTTVDYKRLINGFVLTEGFSLRGKTNNIDIMDANDNKTIEVPVGNTREDIKAREAIISNVYRCWYEANPSKAAYNADLKDVINVRYLSITETMRHAAKSYLSTLAVLQLDLILKNAYQVGEPTPVKTGIKNQSEFSEMIIMECPLVGIGTAKLTVGVKKKTGMKIQYCITAIST